MVTDQTKRVARQQVYDFLDDVLAEVEKARVNFPEPDGGLAVAAEEFGEVAKACLDEPWENVYTECVQAAAMVARLAIEGDPSLAGKRHANDLRRLRKRARKAVEAADTWIARNQCAEPTSNRGDVNQVRGKFGL